MLVSVWCGMRTMQCTEREDTYQDLIYMAGALIMPVYIMLFRIGMDCNLMLAVAAIVMLFVARCIERNRCRDFAALGISSGVLLYTYALSYPTLLIFTGVMFIYFLLMKKINWRQMLCWGIPLAVIALPLILVQFINMFDLPEIKFMGITMTKLAAYRKSEIALSNISLQSIVTCFKVIFGYDSLRYNSLPEFGTVYYISIPFVIIGLIYSVYHTVKSTRVGEATIEMAYIVWFLILFVLGCCLDANVNRLNAVYISVLFFWTKGVWCVISFCHRKILKYVMTGAIIAVYLICFIVFCKFYFGNGYGEKYAPLEFFGYMYGNDVLEYVDSLGDNAPVYVDDSYIYYLGTTLESPYVLATDSDYQRFEFDYYGDIDYFGIYIVKNTNIGMQESLLQKGFKEKSFEHYNVYSYPFDQGWEVLDDSEITWNSGVNTDNILNIEQSVQVIDGTEYVVMVGWTYDAVAGKAWDKVYLQVGTQYYMADVTERTDVVEQTQNEELRESGILFIIPKDKIEEVNSSIVFLKCIGNNRLCELPVNVLK